MIEIEKKFLLTEAQQSDLLDGAQELGLKIVEDSYLDTDTFTLTTNDLWFRERDGAYELKAPLQSRNGSQTKTNRYNEITDMQEIAQVLGFDAELEFKTSLSRAGIKKFMTITTSRKSYERQGFHIDVDSATYPGSKFEYSVAEIELLINSESEADEADRRIVEFAEKFDLTTDQVVLGKVAAYLKAEKPDHYEALVNAGVLK
jgi:adenylate cyclase class IV